MVSCWATNASWGKYLLFEWFQIEKKNLKSILYTKITHKKLYKTTEKYIKCNHTPKFKGGFVC